METFQELNRRVISCRLCPRLRGYCSEIAAAKKKEFRDWEYWGKPVPGFGDPRAAFWIVGLAPAAHGGNRTGRMFTGDSSGRWLYAALHSTGFANQPHSTDREDGLELKGAYVSAAARCAPPDNKPLPGELANCARYLDAEFLALRERRLTLALGAIAFEAVLKLFARQGRDVGKPKPQFGHGLFYQVGDEGILCSYHPSRQNTQTGRLTEASWLSIFKEARTRLEA